MLLTDNELSKLEASWKDEASLSRIESNWQRLEKWCSELGDRQGPVGDMLAHMGERAAVAPASSRLEFHNAFPGGLVDHSLRVLARTIDLAAALKVRVPKESLIISAIFHDWGKVGTLDKDYYVYQDSDWHRKRGQIYTVDESIRMPNAQLGLFVMSQFGVKLTEDEYLAVLLNDGQYSSANKEYAHREGRLALLVHTADMWSASCEKGRMTLLDDDSPKF